MENTELTSYINVVKNKVAKDNGYPCDILGSNWEYAMRLTHRKKDQIKLYEQLCLELVKNKTKN